MLRFHSSRKGQLQMNFRRVALAAAAAFLFSSVPSFAAIPISTTTAVSQQFDSIGTAATASLPADWRADKISTVRTVGNFGAAGTATTLLGGANLSSTASNGIYNFGAGTTTTGPDRAIGFLSSSGGTFSGNLYAQLVNSSGANLSGLQISYNVEKYRTGSNPSGFRIQMFYSTDGVTWTIATDFLTAFPADAANAGFATAPGVTINVNKQLSTSIANGAGFFLAWNYSVTGGTTTTNAQALAVDDISILGIPAGTPTNPTGIGGANPSTVSAGGSTLLTVAVTPGDNPTSSGIGVIADLTAIGGSSSQQFFDDGSNGDASAGDNTFSFRASVGANTSGGAKSLPVTIRDAQSRTGSATISLTVATSTPPSGTGSANPSTVDAGQSTTLSVNVTPGTNPASSLITVTGDLSSVGGSATQTFNAAGNLFTFPITVASTTAAGPKSLSIHIADAEGRASDTSISLTVTQPPPPLDHIVISQIYGGGGNSNATFSNDFVELFNPTTATVDITGWSIQYSSATGISWQSQPLGGVMNPSEYYLVKLAAGTGNAPPLPVTPNISGDINMSATVGKVALLKTGQPLAGGCPSDPQLVDLVGYGATPNCWEGASAAPAPGNSSAIFRRTGGFVDTNNNGSDFGTGVPAPRRTAAIVPEFGPWISSTDPRSSGVNAPHDASITIDFSEPVSVDANWYDIQCSASGSHNDATIANTNPSKTFVITPNVNFQFGEQCTVTIAPAKVHDLDTDDSAPNTDTLVGSFNSWSFTVVGAGAPAPYSPDVHLTMGNPTNAQSDLLQPNNYLMMKATYALSFNRDKGTPNWVSWHLEPAWYGSLVRFDTFRPDPAVPPDWYRVQAFDFQSTGFDRGHMCPNADRDNENRVAINQETYLMTNMVPQSPDNNQGPWANLENYLRSQADAGNEIYIVAGPAGVGGSGSNGGTTTTLAGAHVTVPAYTWKAALVLPKADGDDVSRVTAATRVIAVTIPNIQGIRTNDANDWKKYLTSVDFVEQLTGYDLFSNVPQAIQNAIEAGVDGVNPPGAANQSITTREDTPGTFTLDVANPISAALTYTIVGGPAHGTVSGGDGSETYTPAPDYNGSDSFTYRVSNSAGISNTATVTVSIFEVNDPPAATGDSKNTDEDTPLAFAASELTSNDTAGPANEASQTLTVTAVNATADTHGGVALSGAQITYAPDANYNGPASFTYQVCDNGLTAGQTDSKCATGTVHITVAAVNDPPTAVIDAPATTAEGSIVAATVKVTDPDADEAFSYAWSVTRNGAPWASGNNPSFTFTAVDNGSYVIAVVVGDRAGATGSDTKNVLVTNVAPAVTSATLSSSTIDENGTVSLTGTFVDPGVNDTHVVSVNWGDGSTPSSLALTRGDRSFVIAHQYLDNGTYTLSIVVTDNDGGTATSSASVVVSNVAPVITSITAPNTPLQLGSPASVVVKYSDAGSLDTHTALFTWDDGSSSTTSCANGTCTATHTFASTGVFAVSVTVSDDDGGSAAGQANLIIVVDRNGGFVTGGGWIASAGGKLNFALNAKYQKNQTSPGGNTEVQGPNFNFHGTKVEWLVVAGAKAQYAGTGTMNGAGSFGFLATATDGDPDAFRIRIWDTTTGATVFDNVSGASDDIDSANPQPIGGGNITIHN